MKLSDQPQTKKVNMGSAIVGAIGGALGAGLVGIVPSIPTAAVALTFVTIFGLGIYGAIKDLF